MTLTNQKCTAGGCERLARCRAPSGPLCGMHYQRFAKYGSVVLPTRRHQEMPCATCGNHVEDHCSRVRFKRRGYGYCSTACAGAAKIEQAQEDVAMRFMRRVSMLQDDECWPFNGKKDRRGYSVFHWRAPTEDRARPHHAHRMMWLILNGQIPSGKEVCHSCDNPGCCNPGHLWLGTHKENMEDMARKGRGHKHGLKGSDHPSAKLTTEQVLEIRASVSDARDMARRFRVTPENIRRIRQRKSWAHV